MQPRRPSASAHSQPTIHTAVATPPRRYGLPTSLVSAAVLLALVLVTAALLQPTAAHADTLEATAAAFSTDDPDSITFTVRVTAPAGLREATLRYRVINPTGGDVGGRGDAAFGPGPENDLRFTLRTRTPSRYIPVGSRIVYHWELTDTEGDTLRTPEEEFVFVDGRFDWQTVVDGEVTVYYYHSEQIAQQVVAGTRDALERIGALLGAELTYPTRVFMWESLDDGDAVLRSGQEGRSEFTRLGGQRVSPDVLFLFDSNIDTARHEAAHIITHNAGDGAFVRLPSWLDEGTAVYAQTFLDPSYVGSLANAIDNDETLSLRSVNTPPGDNSKTLLFYGQSAAVVRWMIEEHGEEAFASLYAAIRDGSPIDDALEAVYSFNQDGLYNAWRDSVGLPPVAVADLDTDRNLPVAEATRGPLTLPTSPPSADEAGEADDGADAAPTDEGTDGTSAASAEDDDDGGGATALFVGAAAVLAAAVLGGGAVFLMRRSRGAA